jgi:hypothetical protein
MRSSRAISSGNLEDRDLACAFSPYKFYVLITIAVVLGTLIALRGFRFVSIVAQHLRWIA